ncbi:Centromere Cenp-K protein [Rutstroemia sp. NJR-2017a BVV2]|nr:Centromere Cenp-K protein [Rutstroemia sp. NJR-2017a BVV2]
MEPTAIFGRQVVIKLGYDLGNTQMDIDQEEESRVSSSTYTARLDRTLKDLQDRVKEQELVLQELRANAPTPPDSSLLPSQDPRTKLSQILAHKEAYQSILSAPPHLPPANSPLPALLAYRTILSTLQETHSHIPTLTQTLNTTLTHLSTAQSQLHSAQAISSGLESRILSLQQEIHQKTQKTPSQVASDLRAAFKQGKRNYDASTSKLVRTFNEFIDEYLSLMLAAEELGGPIVGEMMDVTPAVLAVGFSAQGKPKRTREGKEKEGLDGDMRQMRIDKIWGVNPRVNAAEDGERGRDRDKGGEWDERTAAAAEMRDLAEQLLNALLEKDETGTDGFIEIERETSAVRFLVRSKVAQFHFKDARRLRLVDFEKDIE